MGMACAFGKIESDGGGNDGIDCEESEEQAGDTLRPVKTGEPHPPRVDPLSAPGSDPVLMNPLATIHQNNDPMSDRAWFKVARLAEIQIASLFEPTAEPCAFFTNKRGSPWPPG
ncbi:hypothetical protein chiPu_0020060 [Chiloscyllium punctatum]|uniref:Uncharacterized protein n=1 Tax=Chiloscyllium punctatum TaxID=137246 RepID=A0A401RTZ0_CHIPU|nr:hypothetical protein [Chiloscyllium punctatum]